MTSRINCLPVYIVIDSSSSMIDFEDLLNQSVETLYYELRHSPRILEFAHVSIISFNTTAEVLVQMTGITAMSQLPQLRCDGITDLGGALRLVRERIDHDIPLLTAADRQVLRPVVFLLTDGWPTDRSGNADDEAWKVDYAALVDPEWRRRPNVVPFGYGDAPTHVLQALATIDGAAFRAVDGVVVGAIEKIIPTLLNTLVASARHNELRLPANIEGFIRVSPDIVD